MGLATSFVNGNTVVPQAAGGGAITSPGPLLQVDGVPWSDVVGLPRGWGRAYRGKRGEHVWFHASVPTPVRVDGAQVLVQDVFSLFWADAPCFMSDLHVWDGPDFLQAFDQLHTTGDQSHNVDRGVNAFQPRPN